MISFRAGFAKPLENKPNVKLGMEVAASAFGEATIGSLEISQTAVDFLGVVSFDVNPKYRFFAKAGASLISQNYELFNATDHEDSTFKFMGSIGGEMTLNDKWSATLTLNYIDGEEIQANTNLFEGHIASTVSAAVGIRYNPA